MLRSELVTTWNDMDRFEATWNTLWRTSPVLSQELGSYRWCRELALSYSEPPLQPWCVILFNGASPVGLACLFHSLLTQANGRLRLRVLTFFPGDMQPLHGFLAHEDNTAALAEHLLHHVKAQRDVDLVYLPGLAPRMMPQVLDGLIGVGGRVSLLQTNLGTGGMPGSVSADRCSVGIRDSWDSLLASRSQRFRHNYRRRLAMAQGDFGITFTRHSYGRQIAGEPMELNAIVDHIAEIEECSWQKTDGVHLSRFGSDALQALLSRAADESALDISFLLFNDEPVAYMFGLRVNDYLRACAVAYKHQYARYSPGLLLFSRVIGSVLDASGITEMNLGGSRHQIKQHLADLKDSSFTIYLYGNTMKGHLLYYSRRMFGRWHAFP